MLTLNIPETLAGGPFHHIDQISLDLVVWYDSNLQQVKYAYTPGSNINFLTDRSTQELTIRLHSPVPNRFHIFSYAFRDKAPKGDVYCDNGGGFKLHQTGASPQFPSGTQAVRFQLKLRDKQGTYITLHVLDTVDMSLIDCDPQVENGTKT